MEKKYIEDTEELIDFIKKSPSPFHVIANAREMLLDSGFSELKENRPFSIEKGKSYFVVRNNSAIIAFRIPKSFDGFHIVSAHTDSPCFKIKANPEIKIEKSCIKLNTEGYGGMLLSPWFDRPLSIAGRVFIKNGDSIEEKLVDFADDMVSIVNLAIHQNREANNGYKYSMQKEFLPIWADSDCTISFTDRIGEHAGCNPDSILDYDLFLYNRTEPVLWGVDKAFFSSPKIDDLQCAYSALSSILKSSPENRVSMVSLFDNEETGSGTKQGALSDFLSNTISRICISLKMNDEDKSIMIANSRMISADNGHAMHPNYPEKCDVTNKPKMNGGILLKYSANQKYTTDGESGSYLKNLMISNDIPFQIFLNNSDVPGGSTLGNLSTQKISMKTADIGVAQLAMHSCYETAGTKDTTALKKLFYIFLSK